MAALISLTMGEISKYWNITPGYQAAYLKLLSHSSTRIEQVSGIANRDQFNSIHEDLIKRWKTILPRGSHVHFAACQEAGREDWGNLQYLMDTAYSSSTVSELSMENIGWNGQDFVDPP